MAIDIERANNLLSEYGIANCHELKNYIAFTFESDQFESKMTKTLFDKLLHAADNSKANYNPPYTTFGVELEFVGTRSTDSLMKFSAAMHDLTKNRFFYSGNYYHNDGAFWALGRDGSIKFSSSRENPLYGFELSSAKLSLCEEDLLLLQKSVELIKEHLHGEVNYSCGTHIHIGFDCSKLYRHNIERMLQVYAALEKTVFDPIVPTSRRRNKYCKSTSDTINSKYRKLSARYCIFSYDSECRIFHVECRQLEGTLDYMTIYNWLQLQTTVIYDIVSHIEDEEYLAKLSNLNAFDVLLRYHFSKDLIEFFIKRILEFKSRSIQLS